MVLKVFLDIDIGDAVAFAEHNLAHERAARFLSTVGVPQLGLPSQLVRAGTVFVGIVLEVAAELFCSKRPH